jgi:hypothetical protein
VPGFQFAPKVYDFLKAMVLVGIPGFSTFYFTVGTIWDFPATEQVTGTLAALAAFVGILIGISKSNYTKSDDIYDGRLLVEHNTEAGVQVNLDLRGIPDFMDRDSLVFKVVNVQHDLPALDDLPDPTPNHVPKYARE